jgi:transcription termination factor Rho
MANHQRRSPGRQPADTAVTDAPNDTTNGQGSQSPQGAEGSPVADNAPDAAPAADAPPRPSKTPTLNINDLKDMSIQKLTQVAKDLNVAGATGMRKQDLIFQILKAQTELSGFMFSEGVLEVLP